MSQNTEQKSAVRTRDEQITSYPKDAYIGQYSGKTWVPALDEDDLDPDRLVEGPVRYVRCDIANHQQKEAEARGAAEERAKGVDGGKIIGWVDPKAPAWRNIGFGDQFVGKASRVRTEVFSVPILLGPANVAALEARIAELEGENTSLKKRVINAAETLLSIETPCMEGDNFAVTICSYFEDCEGEPCDNGWHEGATKAYEEIKDAVLQHFRAALTREGGV